MNKVSLFITASAVRIERKGFIMRRKLGAIAGFFILGSQLYILFLWMADWEKLTTVPGFVLWGASIILGLLVSLIFHQLREPQKYIRISKNLLFSSTIMTILLAVMAAVIEMITSSMP
jgi:predicted membrane channel-forming protein YqfA (hemolysin III family)